ncbi:hypothetical protein GHT06_018705 [Daphnia sinensis]|uniref:Chitin-binding type-2 domain-containing protein n=1 Tax=Daphnia sinensis TaxID=1820382 RepID=A0AAD5KMR1_9CRUS|nr:hypothetical protein GHT06_018705 [Daphnia sinensis]
MPALFTLVVFQAVLSSIYGASLTLRDPSDETSGANNKCEMSRRPYTMVDLASGQCDAYIRCEGGQMSFELCEDGLVYGDICDMPQRVNCAGRERLQPPKGSGNCPRLNGLYPHTEFCDQYYYCRMGIPLLITCPAGLVYDTKMGVCEFPDEAQRPGCMPEEVLGFTCPPITNATQLTFGDHLRFPKPDDCRYFFKCLKNGYPRLGGCEHGNVFNPANGFCDSPQNVRGCEKYYGEED